VIERCPLVIEHISKCAGLQVSFEIVEWEKNTSLSSGLRDTLSFSHQLEVRLEGASGRRRSEPIGT
jgi:hypothetical protein